MAPRFPNRFSISSDVSIWQNGCFLTYLNEKRVDQKTGMYAIFLSEIIITVTIIFQIGGVGAYQAETFPLLDTIGRINIQDIIQRLAPITILMIGGFIKIIILLFGSAFSLPQLFQSKGGKL